LPANSNDTTPTSQRVRLQECQGCALHDPAALTHGSRIDSRMTDLPCVLKSHHLSWVSLKSLQTGQAKFSRSDPHPFHELNAVGFHVTDALRCIFTLAPAPRPIPPLSPEPAPAVSLTLSWAHHPITSATRTFVRSLLQAQTFNKLIALARWAHLQPLHDQGFINWHYTSLVFNYHMDSPKTHTSFEFSKRHTFAAKLLMNELPLLGRLQSCRRPDLYDPSWNCIFCSQDKETLQHLWVCPTWQPLLQLLMNETQATLALLINSFVSDSSLNLDIALDPSWSLLTCWIYPSSTTADCSFTFASFMQGFIPQDLIALLQQYLPKRHISHCIGTALTIAKDSFRHHYWKPRCTEFAKFEYAKGITRSRKLTSPGQHSSGITAHRTSPSVTRWKSWIAHSLPTVTNWVDFRIYINSL